MTNLRSTLIERWGKLFRPGNGLSPTAKPSPGTDFARLEDRTLFSASPLAEAVLHAEDVSDSLPDGEGETLDYDEVSAQPIHIQRMLQMMHEVVVDDSVEAEFVGGTLMGTDANEELTGGNIDGGYGDDLLIGTAGGDLLDGGHGEDRIEGGGGNDLLVSRSDGREPEIAQRFGPENDPYAEINTATRTLYPSQPIEADDVLIGGAGADTFRFEVLINAKERIILDHVRDDGSIDWMGVAGENTYVHDHWVDGIGNDVIWDFNRAEGDKIEVAGHTVDIYKLEHVDTNDDGVLDASVLYVQSNQGSGGGAHNRDRLGTVTVFGDLVRESDYSVDSRPSYGIVNSIDQLEEALAPRIGTPVAMDGTPAPTPNLDDANLPDGAVLAVPGELDFDGERGNHIEVAHSRRLSLDQGTFALSFVADDVSGRHALFSKDASGNGDGGHLTAFVYDGRIKVRLQNETDDSVYLWSPEGSIQAGQQYHLAVTFGPDGMWLYLDGRMEAWRTEFQQGIDQNVENLAIGANTWSRTEERPTKTYDYFDGRIEDFTIYDHQFDRAQVAELVGLQLNPQLDVPTVMNGRLIGTDADETLTGTKVSAGYGDDTVNGTGGDDMLDGGHGEDRLFGGAGNDMLISRSDGREPEIAQDYRDEDDPDDEINDATRTLYPDQPIEADDVLIGGGGADTFRFEVLINAKRNIILKHVNDDRTIDWMGVAGENDNVHDHWVDRIGDDVIWDFNRAEGDKIQVYGHTVDVYKLEHVDLDNDGILDASILHVQSNQGNNGGAHNKDPLGTITVFGDLVMESDYVVDQSPMYGIVKYIDQLDDALAPRVGTPVAEDGTPPPMPEINDGELPDGAVFAVNGSVDFSGEEDHIEVEHSSRLSLDQGTFALSFVADDVSGRHALFSKDASGNGDGGHLTAFVYDGRIKVRLQNETDDSVYLWSPEGSIQAGQQYHLAVTFGPDGMWLYLDGRMEAWRTEFQQGIDQNMENLAIGANTWSRTEERPTKTYDYFDGRIEDFTIYDHQFDRAQVAELVGLQLNPQLDVPTVMNGRLIGTDADETLTGTKVSAGYGDDTVNGTGGDDMLDGGHGEDRLFGGAGNDMLISRSDGREAEIAQDYRDEDDPDDEINDATRTLYPDQPIEADDVLIGGGGADTFRFEVLINAKRNIILKHVNDDRTIDWMGVAGENNNVHDHWVDRIGDDVIWDFNRAEGDKIQVYGHTVDVYKLEHVDLDNDGILDASILHVQSNQGNNGGAHNKDQLGTITVFGDLVMESDYVVDQSPMYGIVKYIDQLDDALAPRVGTPVAEDGTPPPMPEINDGELPDGAVFAVNGTVDFSGEEDHIEVEHSSRLSLDQGTFALSFVADDVSGRHALFSKDASGNGDGGHLTAFVYDGRIKVRLQNETDDSVYLWSPEGSIQAGQQYHLAVTFGADGMWLYLDGRMEAWRTEFQQGIDQNVENLAIGANTWSRTEERPTKTYDYFDGRIEDFTIYDHQFDRAQVAELVGLQLNPQLDEPTVMNGRLIGTDADETLTGTKVNASYGDDTVNGTGGDDMLDGGHGEDRLFGGAGNDLLISRSDGREPEIAQDYRDEDDPDDEINDATRTLYPDQPIEADDVLIGGGGADTFRFEVLINAKRNIILKHVNDDRTIDWMGVAGENDNVHDHWVDRIGDDVIWDFNRAEGDKIQVYGHTVDVYKLEHVDLDDDGILDASILHVQSNQGNNGGAHNKDPLGTITVFGDLVMESDYVVDQSPMYGIVKYIDQLDDALAPRVGTPVAEDGTPPPMPEINDGELPDGAVFAVNGTVDFSGEEDHIEVEHSSHLALADGTIALRFVADNVDGRNALFSKDASDNQEGGHVTAFVQDGRLMVRLQSETESIWLKSAENTIMAGRAYDLAVSFGADGFRLYLNSQLVASRLDFTQGIDANPESLVIGANSWGRSDDHPDWAYDHFDGRITGFAIYADTPSITAGAALS